MSHHIRFLAPILLVTFATSSLAPAREQRFACSQQETVKRVSADTIDRVLDIVFPMNIGDRSDVQEAWILRFEPSYAPVSLIIIMKRGQRYELFESVAADANIKQILNRYLEKGPPESPEEMAKLIRAQKRSVYVPVSVLSRQLKSFENIAARELFTSDVKDTQPSGSARVFIGGTFYKLRYISGDSEFKYAALGPEIGDSKNISMDNIFGWMENIRRLVRKGKRVD